MNYYQWLKRLFYLVAVFITVVVTFNFFLDPLQFYRRSSYPVLIANERLQNPGLAKNYPYDTIILGTSVCENFIPSYIDHQWGNHTLKLAISGSTLKEHAMTCEVALRSGHVKNVLWGLDIWAARGGADRVTSEGTFPYYLYDDQIITKGQYLFNGTTTRLSLEGLIARIMQKKTVDLDTLDNWQEKYQSLFGKEQTIYEYNKIVLTELNTNEFRLENLKASFDQNVLRII